MRPRFEAALASSVAFAREGRTFFSHWWTLILESLPAGMVMACLVALSSPLWEPVDTLLSSVLNVISLTTRSLTSDGPAHPQEKNPIHILKISEEDFSIFFNNTAPLDRCTLVKYYLEPLLANKNRTLAIDLDLSPVSNRDDPFGCQKKIDALIHKHRDHLILMEPTALNARTDRDVVRKWRTQFVEPTSEPTEAAFPLFGNVEIPLDRGIVKNFERNLGACACRSEIAPQFADLIAAYRLNKKTASATTPVTQSLALLQTWHQQTCFSTLRHSADNHEVETPIPFHAWLSLPNQGLSVLREQLIADTQNTELVILGSGYTPDDQYATPLGINLDGVDIHALVAFTHPRAESPLDHLFHWFIDVFVASVIAGPLFKSFWKKYFSWVHQPEKKNFLAPFLWFGGAGLIGLIITSVIVFSLFNPMLTEIQNFLYRHINSIHPAVDLGIMPIFIPSAILVGMAIDSLAVSSIESASEPPAATRTHPHHLTKTAIIFKWIPFFFLLIFNFYSIHFEITDATLLSIFATSAALICSRAAHKNISHSTKPGEIDENSSH